MARRTTNDVLTEEFLYDMYSACLKFDYVCELVVRHLDKTYLPTRDFQCLHNQLAQHYKKHKMPPTVGVLAQKVAANHSALQLMSEIDVEKQLNPDIILAELEEYIRLVTFQKAYKEIGEMYASQNREGALQSMRDFSKWDSEFTLQQDEFIDVASTFAARYQANKIEHAQETTLKPVTRFYIDGLDEMNKGQDLRGQLTCILASTGVGKSHAARFVGKSAMQMDGLDVLHIQLEGSEKEVTDAYSASLVACNSYQYSSGTLPDEDVAQMVQMVQSMSGSVKVKAFPKFGDQVSTLDVRNVIASYKKKYGHNPDVLVIDSMDLLTDSSGRRWTEVGERHKRVAVANDLKDLAGEENVWVLTTYQATIENREWLDDENNVLTEYNCAEAKGLSRPLTHLITLNQSRNEMKECAMRLYVAKSRFFRKGDPIKIATDYDNEQFYDRVRTMNMNKAMQV